MTEPFSGNKKIGTSILHHPEQKIIHFLVPKVPKWIDSWHLTMATIPVSLLIILFSFLALSDMRWLWGSSLMIALQWLTDSLDGAVGRARNTGLIKWGYYMDHLLDYFFLCAIMIGYMILLPDQSKWLFFFVFALFAGFMVNSFLVMATTNRFRIVHAGVGPTEIRLLFIAINSLLIIFGKTYLSDTLFIILPLTLVGMVLLIYREQKNIWKIDMEIKQSNKNV